MLGKKEDRNVPGPVVSLQYFAKIIATRLPRNQKIDKNQVKARPLDLPLRLHSVPAFKNAQIFLPKRFFDRKEDRRLIDEKDVASSGSRYKMIYLLDCLFPPSMLFIQP